MAPSPDKSTDPKAAAKATKVDVPKAKAVAAPAVKVVTGAQQVTPGEQVKKKEIIDRAVKRSGIKKKDARPAIEAALAVIAEAMLAGEQLNLPPLGKIMVNREKKVPNATMLFVKVRIPNDPGSAGSDDDDADDDDDASDDAPLAAVAEES